MEADKGQEDDVLFLTAIKIEGDCPIYDKGDKTVIKGAEIDLNRSDCVCIHALFSLGSFILALREGISPARLGLARKEGKRGHFQCLDPGKPWTDGGTVTFEIRRSKFKD
jgi:uncharacterized repeat protein (TIGR04076 family)